MPIPSGRRIPLGSAEAERSCSRKAHGLANAKFVLTEEGRRYEKDGSPEVRLVAFLKGRGTVSIKELASASPGFDVSVAVQWAKRNGWIEVKGGEVSLKKMPEGDNIKEALGAVSRRAETDNELLDVLLHRKLISEKRMDRLERAKQFIGIDVNELTSDLIATGLWKDVRMRPYNVEVAGKKVYPGKRQPYLQFVSKMKRKLIELGFREMSGSLVETEFWNFDALYQPQNHPARDWTSTYQLKNPQYGSLPDSKLVERVRKAHETGISGSRGWGYRWDPKKAMRLMPRAHGTCLSARKLASNPEIPGKYFAIARCYRPDVLDSTHLIEFNQVEGIVIDESLNLKSLLGILEIFAKEIAGAEKLKFFPDYYPFTEPSVQLSAKHPELGWIEFGGSGIFREELTAPLGIDVPIIAWGIGIDRLAMFKLGIEDIRYLFSYNLKWLREAKVVM